MVNYIFQRNLIPIELKRDKHNKSQFNHQVYSRPKVKLLYRVKRNTGITSTCVLCAQIRIFKIFSLDLLQK